MKNLILVVLFIIAAPSVFAQSLDRVVKDCVSAEQGIRAVVNTDTKGKIYILETVMSLGDDKKTIHPNEGSEAEALKNGKSTDYSWSAPGFSLSYHQIVTGFTDEQAPYFSGTISDSRVQDGQSFPVTCY